MMPTASDQTDPLSNFTQSEKEILQPRPNIKLDLKGMAASLDPPQVEQETISTNLEATHKLKSLNDILNQVQEEALLEQPNANAKKKVNDEQRQKISLTL